MGLNTDFNQSPYFDDFDETKNYHRVLFKPAVALQAREVTQLQTILQNQIERFGNNILTEGTIIQGGNFIEEKNLEYVKVRDIAKTPLGTETSTDVNQYVGLKAISLTSGVEAMIIYTIYGLETQSPDLSTLYLKYTKGAVNGSNQNITRFSAGEEIALYSADSNGNYTTHYQTLTIAQTTIDSAPVGKGYGVRCGEGIIYQKGHFIRFDNNLTIISKYSNAPDGVVVGFKTAEIIVDSNADSTLLDNASGFNNEKAPGADRLQLIPTLAVLTTEEAKADEEFFAIQEYVAGKVVRRRISTQYNKIEKELERRTSEESGDYVVNRFDVYTSTDPTDSTKLRAYIGPGIAYVDGSRVQLFNEISLPVSDANTTKTAYNQDINTNIGAYVTCSPTTANKPGRFSVNTLETINLQNSSNVTIGTARIRALVKLSASVYRVYLFSVKMNSGQSFSSVNKIKSTTYTGADGGNLTVTTPKIEAETFNKVIFPLGKAFIGTVANTSFIYRTSQSKAITANTVTIQVTGNESFPYPQGSLLPDNILDVIATATSADGTNITAGEVLEITSASLDATQQSLTLKFAKTPSVSVNMVFYYNIKASNVVGATKTLETNFVKATLSAGAKTVNLGVPDAYDILGVWRVDSATAWSVVEGYADINSSTGNITSAFKLVKNDFDDHYGLSFIKNKGTVTISANDKVVVKYRAFKRASTAHFVTVNNYPVDDTIAVLPTNKIRTEDIPTYTATDGTVYYLRDVIDLRPYVSETASWVSTAGAATTDASTTETYGTTTFPAPNKTIETQYSYYLGRNDLIVIDKNGEFKLIQGKPAESPGWPTEPNKGMVLAKLTIPPFPTLDSATAIKLGKPTYGVAVSSNQTQRYTMKDIAGIDQRIKNLEYYTSLSLLESNAKDFQVTDPTGANRFKNGIFVDNFSDLSLVDIKNGEFRAANEKFNISPSIRQYPLDLKFHASSGTTQYNGIVSTLPKTDVLMSDVSQPYATAVKNCTTSFYNYAGKMVIYPEYDGGPDPVKAPDINISIDLATPFIEYTEILGDYVPLIKESSEVIDQDVHHGLFGSTTNTTLLITTDQMQVTAGETTTQNLGDFVTDVSFKPYMRGQDIDIKAVGLRPNTRFYFFFDGTDVNSKVYNAVDYVPTANTSSDKNRMLVKTSSTIAPIFSDSNGVVRAVFSLPKDTYYVGDRKIEILDVNDLADKDAATSYASTTYSAFNFAVTKTQMSATTVMPKFDSVIIDQHTENRRSGSDPIAQTFIIESDRSNDTDVLVTKIDLFFARKSRAGNGVGIQICEVENGIPTGIGLPYSKVHLNASSINAPTNSIATNALTATTFTFEAPVAIKTNREYAVMIAPDANDPDYLVWICRTGETDIDTSRQVVQDVNAGMLFTSTNGKTWTPYQNENLKFNLYAAKFVGTSGTLTLKNNDHEFFEVANLSGDFITGEQVFVKKTTGYANGTVSLASGSNTVTGTSTSFTSQYTADKHIVINTGTGYNAYKIKSILNDTTMVLYTTYDGPTLTANNHYTSPVGRVHYYNGNSPATMILQGSSAETTAQGNLVFAANNVVVGEVSGATVSVVSLKDLNISYIQPMIHRSNFTKTQVDLSAQLYGTTGASGLTANDLALTRTNYLTNDQYVIRSKSNSLTSPSFKLDVVLSSDGNGDTSPVVDYNTSIVMVGEYIINNTIDDTLERQGLSASTVRYVTKMIQLAEGMDAEDLRIILGAYKPTGTDIRVYGKFMAGTDTRNFSQVEWTRMYIRPETDSTSSSVNRFDWREFEYELGTTALTAGLGAWSNNGTINYIDPDGATYSSFKYFAIKVVMAADTYSVVPRLRDIRAIAGT